MSWLVAHTPWLLLFAGIWSLANGVLHDVFVLRQRRTFDKELIRLLIDGHILMFGGAAYLLAYRFWSTDVNACWWLSLLNALFLLGYCALIFKMLPSIGMILINVLVTVVLLTQRFN